jgi:hypothetical protein
MRAILVQRSACEVRRKANYLQSYAGAKVTVRKKEKESIEFVNAFEPKTLSAVLSVERLRIYESRS